MKNTLEYFSDKRYRIYPREYFTAKNIMTGVIEQTKNTCTVHHFATQYHSAEWRKNRMVEQRINRIFGVDTLISVIARKILLVKNRIKHEGLEKATGYYLDKYVRKKNEK
jgi:hypothetical protein